MISNSGNVALISWGIPAHSQWQLCYSLASHGSSSYTFHSNCDNKGHTVTVAQLSTGKAVGGCTSQSWAGSSYASDSEAFLFSLSGSHKYSVGRQGSSGGYQAIYGSSSNLPTFGAGFDLKLASGPYCNLGYSYACRVGSYGSSTCRNDFCGAPNGFSVQKLEVFFAVTTTTTSMTTTSTIIPSTLFESTTVVNRARDLSSWQ